MNNRSRYVPDAAYSMNPYQQQQQQHQQQHYGALPQQVQSQGMMASQRLSSLPGAGQSPIQPSMSPSAMWAANFANGPIIEDLCAPPPPFAVISPPPLNALHHQPLPMAAMHHHSQIQNVYGIRQPAAAVPPTHAFPPRGGPLPSSRVVGSYPPYASQQAAGIGIVYPPPPPPPPPPSHMDPGAMMGRGPGLDTGFASTMPAGASPTAGNATGMGQMTANTTTPNMSGSPVGDGMTALTPAEEEALREFLSPDLGSS